MKQAMSPVEIEQAITDLAEQLFGPAELPYAQTHYLRLDRPSIKSTKEGLTCFL